MMQEAAYLASEGNTASAPSHAFLRLLGSDFSSDRGAEDRGNAAHFQGFGDEELAEKMGQASGEMNMTEHQCWCQCPQAVTSAEDFLKAPTCKNLFEATERAEVVSRC